MRTRTRRLVASLVLAFGASAPPSLSAEALGMPELRRLLAAGKSAYKARDFAAAARAWTRVARQRPSAGLWYRIGVAHHHAGDPNRARATMQRVLALDPAHAKAARALAKIEAMLAEPEPEPPPSAATPDDGEEVDLLARVEVVSDEDRAEQAWTDAHRYRRLGKLGKSRDRFVEAYRFGYARAEVDYYLGRVLLEDEEVAGAILHLERALDEVPEDQGLLLHLSKAYALDGDRETQIEFLQEALEIDPGYGEGHYLLALALDAEGDSKGVLEHAQKALRIDPKYRPLLERGLRDGPVIRRLEAVVTDAIRAPRGAPLDPGEIDVYATQLASLLYPDTFRGQTTRKGPEARRAGKQHAQASSRVLPLSGDLPPDAGMGASETMAAAPSGAESFMGEDLDDEPMGEAAGLGPRPAARASAVLAGVSPSTLRRILTSLHEGEGRRSFDHVPHRQRAAFLNRFTAVLRSREGFAPLRSKVEAALRE